MTALRAARAADEVISAALDRGGERSVDDLNEAGIVAG